MPNFFSTLSGTGSLRKNCYHGGFLNTENQFQQYLPKWNNENINTMIIIVDFVVSRLLLTLFGLALKIENEKNIRLCKEKTDGSFHIDLFIIHSKKKVFHRTYEVSHMTTKLF
jgi:hypothetical protein